LLLLNTYKEKLRSSHLAMCYSLVNTKVSSILGDTMETNTFLLTATSIFLVAILLSSCTTGLSAQVPAKNLDIKTHSIDSDHGYSALGVWSLHIEDQTGTLEGWRPIFSIGPIGAAHILCNYLKTGQTEAMHPAEVLSKYAKVTPVNGSWTKKNEKTWYDGLFVVELQPGKREFFHLRLESHHTISGNRLSEHWLSIPLNAPCKIEASKVYDLKQLEITITEKIKGKNGKIQFNYDVRTTDQGNSNYIKLNEQYPQLMISEDSLVRGCTFRGPETICK
jgi:hypothetical protein